MWPIPILPEIDIRQAREEGVRRLLTESLGSEGWVLDIRVGQTSREIRNVAREIGATVIVMGAAPHRVLGQTVAGARAAQVLRGAACPVLSVAPEFAGLPRTIVVAVDFSPASCRAAQAALFLAAEGATVTLVHAVDSVREGAAGAVDTTGVLFDRLRGELAPYVPAGVVLKTHQVYGEVVQELLQCATSLGAELIAVGTHGPGLVERMFLGSTAANILHLAHCTVLASPAPTAAEAIDLRLHVRGTATTADPDEWSNVLDAVSRRDAGRIVTMEVDDHEVGAQIEARGYVLQGITFDPHDRRVSIMLEAPEEKTGGHLTRSIPNVETIGITTGLDGRDRALAVKHGRGQTLLLLAD
jgi:nucleotide-binding universal stress UspA family protein